MPPTRPTTAATRRRTTDRHGNAVHDGGLRVAVVRVGDCASARREAMREPQQGDPLSLPDAQWHALEAAYGTPPRAYHGWPHVQAVLQHFREVAAGPGWFQPAEAWLAVLYHDAMYEAGRADNEARSADLARAHL